MVLSHCHPAISAGGGERAAYSLFEHLKTERAVSNVVFVARAPDAIIGHSAPLGSFRGRVDEILASLPGCDPVTHMTEDYDTLSAIVKSLVQRFRPDVVHIHHYVFWGIETIEIFKSLGVRVVFTFHEFIAICHRHGQMLKTNGKLCASASPSECAGCFPEHTAGAMFLREKVIKSFLALVDAFVSPSEFVAKRYADWGHGPAPIHVIENPLSPTVISAAEQMSRRTKGEGGGPGEPGSGGRLRIGYFGQINPYKGVDVLLKSLALLPAELREKLYVGLHGANLELQQEAFQDHYRKLLAAVLDCVHPAGAYDNERVLELMSGYDWIIVPSIWWENSPVVIQEALALGKPLLVSRIGGMAEKAASGEVVVFEPGDPRDLARKLASLNRKTRAGGGALPFRAQTAQAVAAILELYRPPATPAALSRAR